MNIVVTRNDILHKIEFIFNNTRINSMFYYYDGTIRFQTIIYSIVDLITSCKNRKDFTIEDVFDVEFINGMVMIEIAYAENSWISIEVDTDEFCDKFIQCLSNIKD